MPIQITIELSIAHSEEKKAESTFYFLLFTYYFLLTPLFDISKILVILNALQCMENQSN